MSSSNAAVTFDDDVPDDIAPRAYDLDLDGIFGEYRDPGPPLETQMGKISRDCIGEKQVQVGSCTSSRRECFDIR